MNFAKKAFFVLGVLAAAAFSFSCATVGSAQISYVIDDQNPLREDSFSINTEPDAQEFPEKKIVFLEEKRETVVDYLSEKNILPFSFKSGQNQLSCYGSLSEVVSSSKISEKTKPVVNKLIFKSIKKNYVWNGFTEYEGNKWDTRFYVTVKGSGEKRKFKVDSLDSGSISMKMHVPFGSVQVDTPCRLSTVTDSLLSYEVYVVVNRNYRAFGKDSGSEHLVKKFTPKITTRDLLNLKGQKLQLLGKDNEVLAESSDGKYRIFLAGDDPRYVSLVQAVALLETYRKVMNKIDSLKPVT